MMNIYLVSQDVNDDYDTYDSFVVVASDEEEARNIHPQITRGFYDTPKEIRELWTRKYGSWARSPDQVAVKLIGTTDSEKSGTIICTSYNAG